MNTAPTPHSTAHPRPGQDDAPVTRLSSLSQSLMQDLSREALGARGRRELLEVLAASVRHGQAVSMRLLFRGRPLMLTVFPLERVMHCEVSLNELLGSDLGDLPVEEVLRPQVDEPEIDPALDQPRLLPPYGPLAPLLWAIALAGARHSLLPELAGQAAYRVAPSVALAGLYIPSAMMECIHRLQRDTRNLNEIAAWHQMGRERATRLLNALYLQSALIVSRTHPAATNEGWSGYGALSAE